MEYIYMKTLMQDGTLRGKVLLPTTYDINVDGGFGASVAIDGNHAIVGAPTNSNGLVNNIGNVYIYERAGTGDWGIPTSLALPPLNAETNGIFGKTVAISGNYAIVGVVEDSSELVGYMTGSAYIYEKEGGIWSDPITLTLPESSNNDPIDNIRFEKTGGLNTTVAIDGDYAIVGADWYDNEMGENVGGAYIYKRVGKRDWGNAIPLTLPESLSDTPYIDTGLEQFSNFGSSVAIDGEYAIVGASLDDNAIGVDAGSAYIYERDNEENWIGPISLILPNVGDNRIEVGSGFGSSVEIDGNYAIVGASLDDSDMYTNIGNAYIYERSLTNWNDPITLTLPTGLKSFARFGFSVSISQNQAILNGIAGSLFGSPSVYTYSRVNVRDWDLLARTTKVSNSNT